MSESKPEDVLRRYLLKYGDTEAELAALDTLLQRLAETEAERDAATFDKHDAHWELEQALDENTRLRQGLEEARRVLKHIWAWQPESQSDPELVSILREQAKLEAEAIDTTLSQAPENVGSACPNCGGRQDGARCTLHGGFHTGPHRPAQASCRRCTDPFHYLSPHTKEPG